MGLFYKKGGRKMEDKKESISFRKQIPASASDIVTERIKAPGTIERVKVKFYQGQQLALQVRPTVEHKGKQIEDLITYAQGTNKNLSGDNDYFEFDVVVSVDYDDEIKIFVTNTDATNNYDLTVDIEIDYFGGKNRVIGGVM
jgi:hypothetical protein